MTRQLTSKFILFITILVVINFALDWSFKSFSVHNALNEKMDEQFAEYSDTLKYLALGNSHNCINTHILKQCFNYGSPSENYIQSYYKLKDILEHTGKKPEYLLLQADVSSFGPKTSERLEYNSYWIKYIDYLELARVKESRTILTKWLEGKFFSYVGNYKDIQLSILYRIKMKEVTMHNGYRPHRDFRNFADNSNKMKEAQSKANIILSKEVYLDRAVYVYFEKILQLCQKHDVKVVLIKYPMTKEFNEAEATMVPIDKLYTEIETTASLYDVYLGMFDYHALYEDNPDYFFDPDHLNIKGSDLLTQKLVEDLEYHQAFLWKKPEKSLASNNGPLLKSFSRIR